MFIKEVDDSSKILNNQELHSEIINAQKGDREALRKVVNYNIGLLVRIATQYSHFGYDLEDLVMEGYEGLHNAIYFFDVTKGYKFTTFAGACIARKIKKYIYEDKKKNAHVLRPTPWICNYVDAYKNVEVFSDINNCVEEDYSIRELYNEVIKIISTMPEKLKNTLVDRFKYGLSIIEIAEKDNISKAGVYNRLNKGLNTIRRRLYDNKIISKEEYIGLKKILG